MKNVSILACVGLCFMCACSQQTKIVSVPVQQQTKEQESTFSLNTREEINAIPKGYGVKGLSRIRIGDKITEKKGTLALLRKKDIDDAKSYTGGTIIPGELEIVPPEMIRPLDGSEGDPIWFNIIADYPAVPYPSFEDMKDRPLPKFITNCVSAGGVTTCSTY